MNADRKDIPPNESETGSDQDPASDVGLPFGAGRPPRPSSLPRSWQYRDAHLPPRNPDFVGREQLTARVRAFVSQPQASGYLVLIGGMGRGKTAFLTDLVHEEIDAGCEPICYFIDYHPSKTGEGDTIVRSLLDQLRSKYPDLKMPEAWQSRPPELASQLEWALRELSECLRWGRDGVAPEVIYIDAADQAEVHPDRPLLPYFLKDLPTGVVCVMTSRPDRRWRQLQHGVTLWPLDGTDLTAAAVSDMPVKFAADPELVALFSPQGEAPSEPKPSLPIVDDRADVQTYLLRILPRILSDARPEPLRRLIDRIVSQRDPPVFFTVQSCLRRLQDPTVPTHEKRALQTQPGRWCAAPEDLVREEAVRAEDRARQAGVRPADFWGQLGLAALACENLTEAVWRGLGLWRDDVTPHVLDAAANFFRARPNAVRATAPIEFDHPGNVREVLNYLIGRERDVHSMIADACLHWQRLMPPARE